jgi:hypothetical protein
MAATVTADVARSTAAELLRKDIVILHGDQTDTLYRSEVDNAGDRAETRFGDQASTRIEKEVDNVVERDWPA